MLMLGAVATSPNGHFDRSAGGLTEKVPYMNYIEYNKKQDLEAINPQSSSAPVECIVVGGHRNQRENNTKSILLNRNEKNFAEGVKKVWFADGVKFSNKHNLYGVKKVRFNEKVSTLTITKSPQVTQLGQFCAKKAHATPIETAAYGYRGPPIPPINDLVRPIVLPSPLEGDVPSQ